MTGAWKKRDLLSKKKAQQLGITGWYSRGYLPHFDGGAIAQTVTFRLFDSMPQAVLEQWRTALQRLPPEEFDRERRKWIDAYLDRGYGSCYSQENRVAEIVREALLRFDGERYTLHAWVVMPNHLHALFTPQAGWEMS